MLKRKKNANLFTTDHDERQKKSLFVVLDMLQINKHIARDQLILNRSKSPLMCIILNFISWVYSMAE